MKRTSRQQIMDWIEDEIDRVGDWSLINISLGISRNGPPCVWYPNDPEQRRESAMTITTYVSEYFSN